MIVPPTGTVTFLFTDIEGSIRLWERNAPTMQAALSRHDEILRGIIEERGGYVFKTVGDAFCAAFATALDAFGAALAAQRALCAEGWNEGCVIRARMALHTGTAEERAGDYFGPPLNRVARILSAGHGAQTLLSLPTEELVRDQLPVGTELLDLGERRLKDLFRPERIFQLVAPDLPAEFPPLRTLEVRHNNLPVQPTPLVGREREVAAVCERLRQRDVRLLTLTGPGGTGKTRLGLQAAAELLDQFEDGVFFVALAPVSDPALMASTIASTLGVKEVSDQPLRKSLEDYLRGKELLLLLDNFEQVLEAAPLFAELLASCPRLKVLATSRAPLGIYGEGEYAVPPLSLHDPRCPPSAETLSRYEAVRLFIERARAAKADFEVTNDNAPAIAEICARLDGLPLAIELAAARIKLLPPKTMLKRLEQRMRFLTGGARNLPERQRTLRGTIEWSHRLLDEGERVLFRRLAVFAGGRTLEAIEEICDAEGDLPVDTLEGVSSLVDKSLLRQEEGPGDEPRFVMLETIHEFAREKLRESGEAERTRRAHAGYFLALAEEAEPELRGQHQVEWLERLEAEHDNMRAALSWALESKEEDLSLSLVGELWWFWYVRGHLSEAAGWLERALSASTDGARGPRARALHALGWIAAWRGDYGLAETLSEGSLALSKELQDVRGIASGLSSLGWTAMYRGDLERASALLEEGVTMSQEVGDDHSTCRALEGLAWVACERGDLELSDSLLEESLVLSRKRGDVREVANSLNDLGINSILRGDYERAATLIEEALPIYRELDDRLGTAASLSTLGAAVLGRGDHEAAEGFILESLALGNMVENKLLVAENLEVLASVTRVRGEASRAARLWGAAESLRESLGIPLSSSERVLHDGHIAAVRSRLGGEAWEEARAEGRAMGLEEAVIYASSRHADD